MSTYKRDPVTGDLIPIANKSVIMTGATSSTNGTAGNVPAPIAGDEDKFFKGNGTWDTPYNNDLISDAWESGVSYAKEDIVIYNNTLYKCKLAHTSSTSITPTNTTYWTDTTLANEIASLNNSCVNTPFDLTIASGWRLTASGRVSCRMKNGRCLISAMMSQDPVAKITPGTYVIATVPSGYRPKYRSTAVCLSDNGNSIVSDVNIADLGSDGNLQLFITGSSTARVVFTLIYDIA